MWGSGLSLGSYVKAKSDENERMMRVAHPTRPEPEGLANVKGRFQVVLRCERLVPFPASGTAGRATPQRVTGMAVKTVGSAASGLAGDRAANGMAGQLVAERLAGLPAPGWPERLWQKCSCHRGG